MSGGLCVFEVSVSARVAPSTAVSLPPGVGMVLWYTTVQAKSKELRAAIIHAEEVEALRRTQQQQPSRTLQARRSMHVGYGVWHAAK